MKHIFNDWDETLFDDMYKRQKAMWVQKKYQIFSFSQTNISDIVFTTKLCESNDCSQTQKFLKVENNLTEEQMYQMLQDMHPVLLGKSGLSNLSTSLYKTEECAPNQITRYHVS